MPESLDWLRHIVNSPVATSVATQHDLYRQDLYQTRQVGGRPIQNYYILL